MGSISRFDLTRIIDEYKTPFFFETGTYKGDGVAYSLQSPFKKIISVEIIPQIAEEARKRFHAEPKVQIFTGDSISVFKKELPRLKGNSIFWLDAHFPGADAGIKNYDAETDEALRLPLAREIATICEERSGFKDVLIIDDLRIYEDGPFKNGNVPVDAVPKGERNINFVLNCFGYSHIIFKSYLDEGYLLLFPKRIYKRKHFTFLNLFNKSRRKPDYYLVE